MGRCITVVATILLLGSGTSASAACDGDCGGDREVTVDELVLGVTIAIGAADVGECLAMDTNQDDEITVEELVGAVSSALNGCQNEFAGDYSGTLDLGERMGDVDLTVAPDGHAASGSLLVDSASLVTRYFRALTFPVGGFSTALTGSVDPDTGSFEVSGSYVDGGQTILVNIQGTLPDSTGSVTISAQIGTETFTGTLRAVAPTPVPTPAATPTPIAGCGDGAFGVTFSNVSGTNADTSPLALGKVTATDLFDGSSNTYIWVITGNVCTPMLGQPLRGIALQGIGQPDRIQPGTYAVGSSVPPFLNLTYTETNITTNPSQNFIHSWGATGGTLVLEDAGNGTLRFHASGVTMVKGLVFQGASGTFTLDISGTIDRVMR